MSYTLVVPQGFPWAIASLTTIPYLLIWQTSVVGKTRGAAGIKYPQAYAEKAEVEASPAAKAFNCAQRAHANTLEFLPIIALSTLTTALKYPIPAAVGCVLWVFSRVLYTTGYATGDPAKRHFGARVGYLPSISLLLAGTWSAISLARETL